MPGFQELIVIAVVALLVFGPDRLPEVARTAGRWYARFRTEAQRNVDELKRMGEIQELQDELRGLRRELEGSQREVQRQLRDVTGDPSRSGPSHATSVPGVRTRARVGSAGSDPGPAMVRPDDRPPPSDPEAT